MIANEASALRQSEADAWFTPGRFAMLLALFIALAFPGILLGQETFFYRDFGLFGYPLAHYQRECFWRGELPLWNPLNDCGLPFMAQWNTLTFYPPALFYLVFPLSWSLGVFNLGHLFLGGMGMYFLARRWTGNALAASVTGVAFAFNGLTWHSLMWPNDIAGLGWMPWVTLAMERAWREGGRGIVWAALAGAMQMLTGAPEIILFTWLFVGVVWLAQFCAGGIPKGRLVMRAVAAGLLVGGLAMVQLLPFMDLLRHSHRDTHYGAAQGWAMPLAGLANFLVPLFHCYPSSHGVFVEYDQYWISSHYLGVAIIALALAGVWSVRERRVWLLAAVAVLSILMALGSQGYVYTAVRAALPMLGFIRYPIKFIVLAMLALPLLAGYGVRRFQEAAPDSAREQKTMLVIAGILIVLIGAAALVEWKYPLVSDDWNATWHNAIERAGFLAVAVAVLFFLRRAREFKVRVLLRIAFLLTLWVDVYTHAPNLSPTVSRSVYEPRLVRQEMNMPLVPSVNEGRFMETLAAMDKVRFASLPTPADDYLCHQLALFDDCNLLDEVAKVDGFYSLYLRDTQEVIAALYGYDGQNMDLKGMKDFLGVAHISVAGSINVTGLDWTNRSTYLPLVTAGQMPAFESDSNTLVRMIQTNFDSREVVYLPMEAKSLVRAKRTDAKIISQNIEAQRLQMTVEAGAPALVVVAQSFYHPWQAFVDGNRVQLWRANVAFQALEIPAGRHEVKLIYKDRALEAGAGISFLSLALLGTIWVCNRRV